MIFLVQLGINMRLLIFQRPQIAHALRAHAILLVFEKIYSCLFIPNCTRNRVITYTYKQQLLAVYLFLPVHLEMKQETIFVAIRTDQKLNLTV